MPLASFLFSILFAVSLSALPIFSGNGASATQSGSEACATCHAQIYESYSKTSMAKASGPATDGLITGELSHKLSGMRYKVYENDGRAWMSYERESEPGFRGQRELLYFIGSGKKGRSYLFSVDGFFFETPVNWYSQEHKWNMTPAYIDARESPMNLPALVDCLNCHTSNMQPPQPGTDSKFSGKPFLHQGITCERCHGAGESHADGKGPIVNPAKLSPDRRDSVCMECHFEGTVAIEQPGKHLYQFAPGEKISDYIHYFLLEGDRMAKAQALSQVEALSLSQCKRKSGDKISCVTCHDPHAEPSAAERAAYYRGKCLSCHGEKFASNHHKETPDCISCHMPSLPDQAVAHAESTDHRILRDPKNMQPQSGTLPQSLVPFARNADSLTSSRDLALAWETLAQRNVEGASAKAETYLRKAVKDWPDDPFLLANLGFVDQQQNFQPEARALYERSLKADPMENEAAANLGILEARSGNLQRAIELWESAFARVPNRSELGMNLAVTFCSLGKKEEARRYVIRVLDFNPDLSSAKQLLHNLEANPSRCTF